MKGLAEHLIRQQKVNPSLKIRNLVFDLDGTIVDSAQAIRECLALAVLDVAPGVKFEPKSLRIGPPLDSMLREALPEIRAAQRCQIIAEFRKFYNARRCTTSPVYPGMSQTLDRLGEAGIRMFLLTNKPLEPTKKILAHHRLNHWFAEVVCPDSGPASFQSKGEAGIQLVRRFKMDPAKTLLVGDSEEDRHAAKACGFHFAHAAFGYGRLSSFRNRAGEFVLQCPENLLNLVEL